MIEIIELSPASAPAFRLLVLPEVQSLLVNGPPSLRMVGAVSAGQPVGLAVANWEEGTTAANLLSLVVVEEVRRKGIGRSLLQGLENVLLRDGFTSVLVEFLEDANSFSPFASLLTAGGFATPRPGIHIWSGSLQVIHGIMWVGRFKLPDAFSLGPWSSMNSAEREAVRAGLGSWYSPIFSPFAEEELIDPELSLVLRYHGEVVGWFILERFDEETVLFKTMFVQQRHQRAGRGVALMAEAGRRVLQEPAFQQGIFFVEAENEAMVRFIQNRIVHPEIQKQILWRTQKKT